MSPRRILIAAVLGAALLVPAPAAAKEIQHVRACGASGCVGAGPLGPRGFALIPPTAMTPALAPFYRLRLEMDGVSQRYNVLWAPREHLIAVDEPNPRWLPATPAAERLARHVTRGLRPFRAALMPLSLPNPRLAGTPVTPATRRAPVTPPAGGPPWVLLAAGIAALAAVGLTVRVLRGSPERA